MTRPALTLAVAHVLTAAGLGYLAADAGDRGWHSAAALLLLAALGAYVAAVREAIHAGTVRRLLRGAPPHSGPIDMADAVVAVARADECCEAWWSSCGTTHAPDCQHAGSQP
ncbi:hypothetical protein ABT071_13795 [Streptomyces sp. NPDC002506]|uniref:hypothetical protein n=1 Tax=Streptomyces sp. NPDC002506 TaxID=3154536 RepID=UPI0033173314